MQAKIRYFKSRDRKEIRDIALRTARGLNIPAPGLVADLLTDYYIFYEPERILVAEAKGEIMGYLMGCFDTVRCRRIKAGRVIPRAIFKALLRHEIGRKEFKYLILYLALIVQKKYNSHPPAGYPAHFHINVAENARGGGIGSKLVKKYLKLLSEARVRGVHVRVRENDENSRAFFQKFGFYRHSGYPTLFAGKQEIRTSRTVIYVKKL